MPRGGARVGAGRPKGSGKKKAGAVKVEKASPASPEAVIEGAVEIKEDPLTYMLRVINDTSLDAGRRDRMAVAAAPYLHRKLGEGGKKEKVEAGAAKASGGKFAPAGAPRLVASNG